MSEISPFLPPGCEPDVSKLVTEDDTPVDNLICEREQRLLVDSLYASWKPGRPFVAMANVGLFFSTEQPPYVPDALVSLDVEAPDNPLLKKHCSYFMWLYGKPPDVVVEVVSNREGHEEEKIRGYARLGIPYYVIHDPMRMLSRRELRAYELHGGQYAELLNPSWIPFLSLGVKLQEGAYQGVRARWLRWCDEQGQVLGTGEEQLAEHQEQLAEQLGQLAEQETLLRQERARREALEARLRELEGPTESA